MKKRKITVSPIVEELKKITDINVLKRLKELVDLRINYLESDDLGKLAISLFEISGLREINAVILGVFKVDPVSGEWVVDEDIDLLSDEEDIILEGDLFCVNPVIKKMGDKGLDIWTTLRKVYEDKKVIDDLDQVRDDFEIEDDDPDILNKRLYSVFFIDPDDNYPWYDIIEG